MTEIGEFRIGEEATLEYIQEFVEQLEDGKFLTEQDLGNGVVKVRMRENQRISDAA